MVLADPSVASGDGAEVLRTAAERPSQSMELEAAAAVLGVHYQTAYRWVRTGVLPAVKVGLGYRLSVEDVEQLAELRRTGRAISYTGRDRDWSSLVDQFFRSAVAGDETAARRVFERLHLARVPIVEQCERLVVPFAARLGTGFDEGAVLPAQVRVAAAICERLLHRATRLARDGSNPAALVVTPRGESHRLPMVMASSVLRAEGWSVAQVDGVVECCDLVALAGRIRARLIVVSTTVTETEARDLAATVGKGLHVPVLVGGAGAPIAELVEGASIAREAHHGRAAQPRAMLAPVGCQGAE